VLIADLLRLVRDAASDRFWREGGLHGEGRVDAARRFRIDHPVPEIPVRALDDVERPDEAPQALAKARAGEQLFRLRGLSRRRPA
ncbi:hypothetical protein ACJEKX_24130, partial [Escherichia coli]